MVTLAVCAAAGGADRRDAMLLADAAAREKVREHTMPERVADPQSTGTPALPAAPIAMP
jgi:hypothetical protein